MFSLNQSEVDLQAYKSWLPLLTTHKLIVPVFQTQNALQAAHNYSHFVGSFLLLCLTNERLDILHIPGEQTFYFELKIFRKLSNKEEKNNNIQLRW